MLLGKLRTSCLGLPKFILMACLGIFVTATNGLAQVTASISGTARDTSGAVVPGASVTVKDVETGATRTAETDATGSYSVPSLAVGQYEVDAEKSGFKKEVRQGITLAVGQEAVVNLTLEIGNVEQQVTVTAEAPLVNTTVSSTSGLINQEQVKDLPLNGRSFDQLLTLNAGVNNYGSASQASDRYSVAGRRPEENRYLLNGIDYFVISANGNSDEPAGSSGKVLGVDAIREFNLVQDTYGAEFGKRAGGQVAVVLNSGTNQLHGDVFEFLRNSVFDARNFFDHPLGLRIPPFKRNQFGGALGGPLKKDKLFLFGNYEGFRQRLGISNVTIVPDNNARLGILPNAQGIPTPVAGLVPGMLPFLNDFWPVSNGPDLGSGEATDYNNPVQAIREDFGLIKFDYNVSAKDSFSADYVIDDGENDLPQGDPYFIGITPLRSQLLGLRETHIFSPALLNVVTGGFSRSKGTSQTIPTVPIPADLSFYSGLPPGTISIGGTFPVSSVTTAGGFGPVPTIKNLFTGADDIHFYKGNHTLSAGVWVQRVQFNGVGVSADKAGAVTFSGLQTFLTDTPTSFVGYSTIEELGFRTTLAGWYVQDEIKLKPNLTVRLGIRDEMTSGWNEAEGRCSNYVFGTNGVLETSPLIGSSCLSQNNALALWEPRVGLAWDPTGTGTWAVRAGFGIYNGLQDSLGGRTSANPPFNALVSSTAPLLSIIPMTLGTAPPSCSATQGQPCSIYSPGGIDPSMHTPTIQEWSLTVERAITRDLALQVGYVGSQSYHLQTSEDINQAQPQVCQSAAGCASGGTSGNKATVPQGTLYMPPGARPNPYLSYTFTWMYAGVSSYNAVNASLIKRTSHGLTFKVNYTYSKILDLDSTEDPSAGNNQPFQPVDIYDLRLSKGIAAFNLRNQFNANFIYDLPFGHGRHWGSGANGFVDKLIGGWSWNGIFNAQSGFPFTPQVGSNISGTGNSQGDPDLPNHNPAFSGPVILGKVSQWFNPNAFLLPTAGTFGNVSRGSYLGPGLNELDTSLFKQFQIRERYNLEFRAEFFNIVNHANFSPPSPLVFSGTGISPTAGLITATGTTSRQVQFGLKLMF